MAQFVMNLLVPALLLVVMVQGRPGARALERCAPVSVEVLQTSNGEKVGPDPVFEVLVRNRCECPVRGVLLHAEGFTSSAPVDPNLFRREGSEYLLGDGSLIPKRGEVRFRYAWDRAFDINPVALQEDCSGVHEFTMS
ncbi:hypothetical protein HU200_067498 [Digitaria exilis]|uniref:Uncharacterized protein n=1 Tax=Digitaria exilis TaxID=1010633 RepID=A0A834ZW77_9POAL|nr:hypothetical protein HU200_067498 [Digitaria exilis]